MPCDLHLVEASPTLRESQRKALAGFDLTHHDSVAEPAGRPAAARCQRVLRRPADPPVRPRGGPLARTGRGPRGRRTRLRPLGAGRCAGPGPPKRRDGRRIWSRSVPRSPRSWARSRPGSPAHGGAALIVDYGDWRSLGDTLQALKAHAFEPPLAHPGDADLTAHVDFEALARAAPGARGRRA